MLPASVNNTESSSVLPEQTCRRFTLAEIQLMTHNFDEALVLGRGGFGKVYKCSDKNRPVIDVAIKRLHSMSNQGASEFWAEVEMLSKLRHCNLVSLIGYCNEGEEMVLVYELMPNGTLEDHLHKANTGLSWLQRLKICIAAARGLDYLHTGTGTQDGVIHRDVKSSNILLDANFAAKISDFGLAKTGPTNQTRTYVNTRVKGTFGYMDPCYFYTGKLTRKSDVYAFGVVLLEVLCGRQAVDLTLAEEQWGLTPWAQQQIKEGKINRIMDSRLMGQISKKCLKDFVGIAGDCLDNQPKRRPTMAEVVVKLQSILSLQEKESIHSVVDEGMFIKKVWTFFSAKPVLMPARSLGSTSENSADIEKSISQSFGTFTYSELETATSKSENSADIEKSISQSLRTFKFSELETATTTIYTAWVDEQTFAPTENDTFLGIYVRTMHNIGPSEVDLKLEEINHPNVDKLLGYCLNKQDLLCVYMINQDASLDRHLFGGTSLSWVARLKIAVGAAEGLSFLHRRKHVAYNQFKTSVILLDKDFNARLSNFVLENSLLVEESNFFKNDPFYAAPERFSYQVAKVDSFMVKSPSKYGQWDTTFTDYFGLKSEIYSFGVVLLEILTGLKVYDVNRPMAKRNLVKWATPLLADEKNLVMIMDPKLQENSHPPKGAFELALLVSQCLKTNEKQRPSMEEILRVLYQCNQDATKSVLSL